MNFDLINDCSRKPVQWFSFVCGFWIRMRNIENHSMKPKARLKYLYRQNQSRSSIHLCFVVFCSWLLERWNQSQIAICKERMLFSFGTSVAIHLIYVRNAKTWEIPRILNRLQTVPVSFVNIRKLHDKELTWKLCRQKPNLPKPKKKHRVESMKRANIR